MSADPKLFGNAPYFALASDVIKMVNDLEAGQRGSNFDSVLDDTVLFLVRAHAFCLREKGIVGKTRYSLMECKSANSLVRPALKVVDIPGANEEERISWLIEIMKIMKQRVIPPRDQREKIISAFRAVSREAIGGS